MKVLTLQTEISLKLTWEVYSDGSVFLMNGSAAVTDWFPYNNGPLLATVHGSDTAALGIKPPPEVEREVERIIAERNHHHDPANR